MQDIKQWDSNFEHRNGNREHEPRPKLHHEADQGKNNSKDHKSNREQRQIKEQVTPNITFVTMSMNIIFNITMGQIIKKSQENPENHHKKDEYDKKNGVLDSFDLFKMSWTTPKFEKLGPMPGGKQGEERQG